MASITILDIAKIAKVSKSTVSRVLNDGAGVKSETRAHVLKVIDEYNFRPSTSARSLRGKSTKLIGIITSRLDAPAKSLPISGILKKLNEIGYESVILDTSFSENDLLKQVAILKQRNIDGIILFAKDTKQYDFFQTLQIPIVVIGQTLPQFPSILYDDYQAIYAVSEYIIEKNCTDIHYFGITDEDITSGQTRNLAFVDAVKKNGVAGTIDYVDFSYESGYRKAKNLLTTNKKVDAIICATDLIALGVYKYLTEISATDSIVVAGTGNNQLVKFLYPNHISVEFNYEVSGRKAASLIEEILESGAPAKASQHIISGELKV